VLACGGLSKHHSGIISTYILWLRVYTYDIYIPYQGAEREEVFGSVVLLSSS